MRHYQVLESLLLSATIGQYPVTQLTLLLFQLHRLVTLQTCPSISQVRRSVYSYYGPLWN